MVLYVYVIQHCFAYQGTWKKYLDIARQCQEDLSTCGGKDSFAQRYGAMLELLYIEALKTTQNNSTEEQTSHPNIEIPNGITAQHVTSLQPDHRTGTAVDRRNDDQVFPDNSVNSVFYDLTGWSEFDTLMAAGFGNLDSTFVGSEYIHEDGSGDYRTLHL